MHLKRLACLAAIALLLGAGTAAAAKGKSAVTVKNKSHWEIHELYLSSSDQDEWGEDQLGHHTIAAKGGSSKAPVLAASSGFSASLADGGLFIPFM